MPQPFRLRPGVKALIVRDHKILVVKEKILRNGEEVILHDFPGGGIEPGETLLEALHREVWEEIHATITIGRVVGAWEFFLNESTADPVQIICIGYECQLDGGSEFDFTQNPAEEDIFEAVWLDRTQLNEIFQDDPRIIATIAQVTL